MKAKRNERGYAKRRLKMKNQMKKLPKILLFIVAQFTTFLKNESIGLFYISK